jgi:hypothetical protein
MKRLLFVIGMHILTLSACAPIGTVSTPPPTEETVVSSVPVPATEVAPPTEIVDTKTYSDEEFGFSFDYPAAWMLDVVSLGDRAPHSLQLTSWSHEPGMISEVVDGGTIVNVVVQLWDPKGDLAAFVQQRMEAWSASGISVLSQDELHLAGNRTAQEFVVQSSDGDGYFLFALLGDQYLVISGSGDIESIRQLAHSLR